MNTVLDLESPYKVHWDSIQESYFFVTQYNVQYAMYLIDSDSHFEGFHLKHNIYTFGFEPVNASGRRLPKDLNVSLTINAFIDKFFQDSNNVLLYTADISEDKHHARKKLFDRWKLEFDKEKKFDKYSVEVSNDNDTYFSSIILAKDNVHKKEYRDAFFHFANKYDTK